MNELFRVDCINECNLTSAFFVLVFVVVVVVFVGKESQSINDHKK